MKSEKSPKQPPIRLNSIGFLPDGPKFASVIGSFSGFRVRKESDKSILFSGFLSTQRYNKDTEEILSEADFSEFCQPGLYYLEVPELGRSASFSISSDVFQFSYYTLMRGMYLWRCGTAVKGTHEGVEFSHDACHLEDAWLDKAEGRHETKLSTGGWHDAGDYNKYVTNAGVTLGLMFQAWEMFGDSIKMVNLELPDSRPDLPDYLTETKWEVDWLFTMQREDGAVYHKVSTQEFGPFIDAEDEKTPRYFSDWSTQATSQFIAMMAMAARNYKPFNQVYANRCLEAALKSWQLLQKFPQTRYPDLSEFKTGTYLASDSDSRLWAAVELWETTGDNCYRDYFEKNTRSVSCLITADWDWHSLQNLAFTTYLLSAREKDTGWFGQRLRDQMISLADDLVAIRNHHGYGRPMGTRYYWGCNGTVARQALLLLTANKLAPDSHYRDTALAAIDHLFGRNVHGRSYVTGLGHLPPLFPHDRRCGGEPVGPAWPGYLVGGPHPRAEDWYDVQESAATNEIAINWNSALIFALAAFLPQ